MTSGAICRACSQARGRPTAHGPGPGGVPFEQCLFYRPLPAGATTYKSKWERSDFGFYTGSSVVAPEPEPHAERPEPDAIDRMVARLEGLHAKAELVIKKIRDATERRRVLRARLQTVLDRSKP